MFQPRTYWSARARAQSSGLLDMSLFPPRTQFRTLKHAFCFSLGPTGLPEPGLQVPDSAGGVPEPEKGVAVHHGLRLGGAQRLKEQFHAHYESIFSQ